MNDEKRKLLYIELESHLKSQPVRDSRIQQLRLFSGGIITAILSFAEITLLAVIPILVVVGVAILGLCIFDMFYRKIARQVDGRVVKIKDAMLKEKEFEKIEPFEAIDKLCLKCETEQLWYLLIIVIASLIVLIKGCSNLCFPLCQH
jgi:hypothetical protein